MTTEEIIRALRCSSQPLPEGHSCKGCPYLWQEDITDSNLPQGIEDYIKDGRRYVESCDCERICLDAAGALERLVDDGK